MLPESMNTLIFPLALAVTTIATVGGLVLAYYAIHYLKASRQAKLLDQAYAWAHIMVNAVEQRYQLDGPRKLEIVTAAMRTVCGLLKVQLTDEQIRNIIEANVRLAKTGSELVSVDFADLVSDMLDDLSANGPEPAEA